MLGSYLRQCLDLTLPTESCSPARLITALSHSLAFIIGENPDIQGPSQGTSLQRLIHVFSTGDKFYSFIHSLDLL